MFTLASGRVLWIDLFSILFGVGAWLAINGLWAELPLLVQALPEGWNLSSYLSLIIEVANIGPIGYSVLKWYKKDISKEVIIYILIALGFLSTFLLIFFWDQVTYVGGTETSLCLFILVFFLSLVDCTSSVLFIPFMSMFPKKYLTSYLIGEGLSGFLPSIVALGQGAGDSPTCINRTYVNMSAEGNLTYYQLEYESEGARFSVAVFLVFLVIMTCASGTGFLLLNVSQVAKRTKISTNKSSNAVIGILLGSTHESPSYDGTVEHSKVAQEESKPMDSKVIVLYLVIVAVTCGLGNGVLPSIQTFSCLPYGNTAAHLAVTLYLMANPLACTVAFVLTAKNVKTICGLAMVVIVAAGYILATAIMSPIPPLVGTRGGEFLMIVAWVVFNGLLSYIKICIATAFHHKEKLLFYYGAVTQAASAISALVMFFVVNYTDSFVAYDPCAAGDVIFA